MNGREQQYIAKFIFVKENTLIKNKIIVYQTKKYLYIHEKSIEEYCPEQVSFVVVEKCCPEKDSLSHIVAVGEDDWSGGRWRDAADDNVSLMCPRACTLARFKNSPALATVCCAGIGVTTDPPLSSAVREVLPQAAVPWDCEPLIVWVVIFVQGQRQLRDDKHLIQIHFFSLDI